MCKTCRAALRVWAGCLQSLGPGGARWAVASFLSRTTTRETEEVEWLPLQGKREARTHCGEPLASSPAEGASLWSGQPRGPAARTERPRESPGAPWLRLLLWVLAGDASALRQGSKAHGLQKRVVARKAEP